MKTLSEIAIGFGSGLLFWGSIYFAYMFITMDFSVDWFWVRVIVVISAVETVVGMMFLSMFRDLRKSFGLGGKS